MRKFKILTKLSLLSIYSILILGLILILGCLECPNTVCPCFDSANNPNYKICEEIAADRYVVCISVCHPGDVECFQSCSRLYGDEVRNCPCQERVEVF